MDASRVTRTDSSQGRLERRSSWLYLHADGGWHIGLRHNWRNLPDFNRIRDRRWGLNNLGCARGSGLWDANLYVHRFCAGQFNILDSADLNGLLHGLTQLHSGFAVARDFGLIRPLGLLSLLACSFVFVFVFVCTVFGIGSTRRSRRLTRWLCSTRRAGRATRT